MKKSFLLSVIICLLPSLFPSPAEASNGRYIAYVYSSSAASGSAITSDVINTSNLESLTIVASAATADRTLTVNCLAVDEATVLFTYPVITLAAAGQAQATIFIRPDVTAPASPTAGITTWNTFLCNRMQVLVGTAAGAGTLDITGRRNQVASHIIPATGGVYESGSVIAGAAISSGVLNTARVESLTILVEATTTNRALVVNCVDANDTVLFAYASLTVTAGSKYMRIIGADPPVPGTEPTNVSHIVSELCPYMRVSVAAAGAASAKLAVYKRN